MFLLLLALPIPGLPPPAQRLAAVLSAVVILWMTEALPLPVTALLGAAFCVVLGVAPAREVFAPFADPLMFLFIGAFILARAIFLHRLDKRFAYSVLSLPWVSRIAVNCRPYPAAVMLLTRVSAASSSNRSGCASKYSCGGSKG